MPSQIEPSVIPKVEERYFHIRTTGPESYGREGTVYFRRNKTARNLWDVGVSILNPKDNFCRATGRSAARRHCLVALQKFGTSKWQELDTGLFLVDQTPTMELALECFRDEIREVLPQVAEKFL